VRLKGGAAHKRQVAQEFLAGETLHDLAKRAARVRYGYRRLHVLLRREGWPVNHMA
jgi:hypothetical protein